MVDVCAEGVWEFVQLMEECVGDGLVVRVDWNCKFDVCGVRAGCSVTTLVWGGVIGGL